MSRENDLVGTTRAELDHRPRPPDGARQARRARPRLPSRRTTTSRRPVRIAALERLRKTEHGIVPGMPPGETSTAATSSSPPGPRTQTADRAAAMPCGSREEAFSDSWSPRVSSLKPCCFRKSPMRSGS